MDTTEPTTDLFASIRERTHFGRSRREASVKPEEKVRDGLGEHLLRVETIVDTQANEYTISGSPLPEYGQNTRLDCGSDVVVECSTPLSADVQAYPVSRLIPLEVSPRNLVRDRFTGDILRIEHISDTPAEKCLIDEVPLSEFRENQTLACRGDWVVGCSYHCANGGGVYDFPISRLAPGKYPTSARAMKEKVRSSKKCFSCRNGMKQSVEQSVCRSCRGRIFARDGSTCQHMGCTDRSVLVIHHLSYAQNPITQTIPDRYLISLCNAHHRQRHGIA